MSQRGRGNPGNGTRVRFAGKSEAGRVRSVNQDSFRMGRSARGGYLAVVADGMGGHRSGEIASGKAVETMWEQFERRRSLPALARAKSVRVASQEIVSYASQPPEIFGMGSTLTAVYLDDQAGANALAACSR